MANKDKDQQLENQEKLGPVSEERLEAAKIDEGDNQTGAPGESKEQEARLSGAAEGALTSTREKRPAPSQLKVWMSKKWVSPVIYLVIAVIIFTVMWQMQNNNQPITQEDLGINVTEPLTEERTQGNPALGSLESQEEVVPVAGQEEASMIHPVDEALDVVVKRGYFEEGAEASQNAQAVVQFQDTFKVHQGLDYAAMDDSTFNVLAALSGKVTRVAQDPLVGHLVEIEHQNGLRTVYQSLSEVNVTEGDEVSQGEVIAQAGRNQYERDSGNHLHFEVWQDNELVSPLHFLDELKANDVGDEKTPDERAKDEQNKEPSEEDLTGEAIDSEEMEYAPEDSLDETAGETSSREVAE